MKVAIGSTNPVKIRAVTKAFRKSFSQRVEVISIQVSSGVSDQPQTDEEAFLGALNRAKNVKRAAKVDYGVGIEGGIQKHPHGIFSNAWVVIIDRRGRIGSGTSARFPLPKKVLEFIAGGDELGVAIDKLVGGQGPKRRGGAYSALTAGKLSRTRAYEQGVLCALMPFLTPKFWS